MRHTSWTPPFSKVSRSAVGTSSRWGPVRILLSYTFPSSCGHTLRLLHAGGACLAPCSEVSTSLCRSSLLSGQCVDGFLPSDCISLPFSRPASSCSVASTRICVATRWLLSSCLFRALSGHTWSNSCKAPPACLPAPSPTSAYVHWLLRRFPLHCPRPPLCQLLPT